MFLFCTTRNIPTTRTGNGRIEVSPGRRKSKHSLYMTMVRERTSSVRAMIGTIGVVVVVVVATLLQALLAAASVMAFTATAPPTVSLLTSRRWSTTTIPTTITPPSFRRLLSTTVTTTANGETAPASTTSKTTSTTTTSSSKAAAADNHNNTNNNNINIRLNVFEKARTVTSVCTSGTLCTMSSYDDIQGAPFGSFVDYVLDNLGNPVLLMNEMSMHTMNIQKATELSVGGQAPLVTLFTQLSGGSGSSLGSGPNSNAAAGSGGGAASLPGSKSSQDVARCSLTGTLEKIDVQTAMDLDVIRMRYSLTHAYADQVMDSPKFAFYRLTPRKIYYVGGFGVLAKWVEPQDYQTATPDILAKDAADILQRINRHGGDYQDDLRCMARQVLKIPVNSEIERIVVTNVDRLGMDVRVTCQMGSRRNKLVTDEFRIGFRIPVISVEDAKSEILKIFQEAWEKANGYTWATNNGDNDDDEPGIPILKIAADSLE